MNWILKNRESSIKPSLFLSPPSPLHPPGLGIGFGWFFFGGLISKFCNYSNLFPLQKYNSRGPVVFFLTKLICNETKLFPARYLRNRKHVPCFYRVIQTQVEVWENEKCCGNTSRRRVFPQLFWVLPNFRECLYNSIETRSTCFLFLLENTTTRKRKTTC